MRLVDSSGLSSIKAEVYRGVWPADAGVMLGPRRASAIGGPTMETTVSLPAPPSMEPFNIGQFTRLPGHRRSFFQQSETYRFDRDRETLVFKGCEAASEALAEDIEILKNSRSPRANLSLLEYLVLVEGKLPLALSKNEAIGEYDVALAVQSWAKESELLVRTACPTTVFRLSQKYVERYKAIVASELSLAAYEVLEALIQEGLFIYCYSYVTAPVRVANLPKFSDLSGSNRVFLVNFFKQNDIPERWLTTLSHFYDAGIRVSRSNAKTKGAFFDTNNATIDGGFLDLDGCSFGKSFAESLQDRRFLSFDEMEVGLRRTISFFEDRIIG